MRLITLLKKLFSWGTAPVGLTKARKNPYEPYATIIESALHKRGTKASEMDVDPVHRAPQYIVRLCKALVDKIQEAGNSSVTLEDVVRAERSACGHTDYHRKFSMYCSELARKGLVNSGLPSLRAR